MDEPVNPIMPGHGWGFFWFGQLLGGVLLAAAIVVVAVLLIRYLVVATRAAQLYLDLHKPEAPASAATPASATPAPAGPAPTASTPVAEPIADPTPPNVPAGTKRPTRPRTPKPPAAS